MRLVVPTLLRMGWIESPPYFCAASKTARDVAAEYCETGVGTLPTHKFLAATRGDETMKLGEEGAEENILWYIIEVYVDDFISLVMATSQRHLDHVVNAVMHGIHDVFPPAEEEEDDPISRKKLKKGAGGFATRKVCWVLILMEIKKPSG